MWSWAAWLLAGLYKELFWTDDTRLSLFSDDSARPNMRFLACLLATAVLPPAANASPTSILPSFFTSWSQSLISLRWGSGLKTDGAPKLGKRQSDNAFDHNPDGSQFLWVLQDTYQGQTFFECVAGRWASGVCPLTFPTVDGNFLQELIRLSESPTVFDGDEGQ